MIQVNGKFHNSTLPGQQKVELLGYCVFVFKESGQRDFGKKTVNELFELTPNRSEAAMNGMRANNIFLHFRRAESLVNSASLQSLYHLPDRDLSRVPGQQVPAMRALDALHNPGPFELEEKLLHIIFGHFFLGGNGVDRQGLAVSALTKGPQANQRIFALGGKSHKGIIL